MKTTVIRQSQIRVLGRRLFSYNVDDVPLIEAVAEYLAIELPEMQGLYQMEIWYPMKPKKLKTYEIHIVVSERVVSTTPLAFFCIIP